MSKENQNTTINGTQYQSTFAFRFVGTLISHDKRFFETIKNQLNDWTPFILSNEVFNEPEERHEFFSLMSVLNDLADITKNLSEDELNQEFKNLLNLLGFKKESEVPNG
jgi:hypothetical protein